MDYSPVVTSVAQQFGVPPDLALGVMGAESGGNPLAVSPKGARGLFQLMPDTAKDMGVANPFDPTQNITGGVRYLSGMLQKYGDPATALTAYNWGPGNVDKFGVDAAPPETKAYVAKVTGNTKPADDSFLLMLNGVKSDAAPSNTPAAAPAQPDDDPFMKMLAGTGTQAAPSAQRTAPQSTAQQVAQSVGAGDSADAGASQAILPFLGNLASGAIRGAGSIGATIVSALRNNVADPVQAATPVNMRPSSPTGQALKDMPRGDQLRQEMDAGLQSLGADPNSLAYMGGKLGAEIAGTSGLGGVLGNGLRTLPIASRFAAPVINAVETGGFRTGATLPFLQNAGVRVLGGAVNGGATAGLVDPSQGTSGAVIGGALPPVAQGLGRAGIAIGNAVKSAVAPTTSKIAQGMADAFGVTGNDITSALTGPQMIPGYVPTVPQIVQNPVASQLQRTLKTAGSNVLGEAEKTQQGQFLGALNRVAPIGTTVQDAAERAGNAIQAYATPAEAAARQRVSDLFNAVPADQAVMNVPLGAMTAARDKFMGPGTFGKGGAAVDQALETAQNIGTTRVPVVADYSSSDLSRVSTGHHGMGSGAQSVPQPVPFDQLQNLRSSIGEAITGAQKNGQARAVAALTTMKNAIDNKVADVASGNAQAGEVFTPQAIDAWGQALAAHGGKKLQFNTGPQAAMFRMGADGQPAIQGAEIPGKFYNGNRSQVNDMQAFKRLIADQPSLANEMKQFAVTQGYGTSNQAGDLTSKFVDWLASRSGANRELFTPQEMATLNQVGDAVQRSMTAENLGRVTGPDTAQKLASLQSNGLLDNSIVGAVAHRIPLLGRFSGAALDALRSSAAKTRMAAMGGLLANPQQFADALQKAPNLLTFNPEGAGLLGRAAYRTLPLLPAQ